MRIALFTDIHANREALTACLDHAERGGIARFIFLGDYVGYGADPGWAVDMVMRQVERGAVALAVKHHGPQVEVTASDRSAAALQIARANAGRHGLRIEFTEGDWWQAVAGRRFGLAVSNPPYVAGDDPHLAALAHEPRRALTPEGDGLAAIRQLIADAPAHLLPGAWLLLEHGYDQADAVQALLAAQGFVRVQSRNDLADIARCTGGQWPTVN